MPENNSSDDEYRKVLESPPGTAHEVVELRAKVTEQARYIEAQGRDIGRLLGQLGEAGAEIARLRNTLRRVREEYGAVMSAEDVARIDAAPASKPADDPYVAADQHNVAALAEMLREQDTVRMLERLVTNLAMTGALAEVDALNDALTADSDEHKYERDEVRRKLRAVREAVATLRKNRCASGYVFVHAPDYQLADDALEVKRAWLAVDDALASKPAEAAPVEHPAAPEVDDPAPLWTKRQMQDEIDALNKALRDAVEKERTGRVEIERLQPLSPFDRRCAEAIAAKVGSPPVSVLASSVPLVEAAPAPVERESDRLRAELDQARRDRDEQAHWRQELRRQLDDLLRTHDELEARYDAVAKERDAAREELDQAQAAQIRIEADYRALRGELATICGGPEKRSKGESVNVHWLRRLANVLGEAEDEKNAAVTERDAALVELDKERLEIERQRRHIADAERERDAGRAEATAMKAERDALHKTLVFAEAALSDIGDADREPGDDLAWCEARAAEALPRVRAAIAQPATAKEGK